MKFLDVPEPACAVTSRPPSIPTRYNALGSTSSTVPDTETLPATYLAAAVAPFRAVSTIGPFAATATVCSK